MPNKSFGITVKVYEITTLPNTARQLVEAIRDQKDLSMDEALEMADYLDERYGMSDNVPTNQNRYGFDDESTIYWRVI